MFSIARRIAVLGGTAGLLALGIAAPAVAQTPATCTPTSTPTSATDDCSVSVTASVNETVTISGLTTPIAFGTVNPGVTALAGSQASPAESYTVTTNDPAGFGLVINADGTGLSNGSATIPNSDLSVAYDVAGGVAPFQPFTSNSVTVLSPGWATSPQPITDWWSLAVPANAGAGNYSESVEYLATAS
jgi:hypothetical protein